MADTYRRDPTGPLRVGFAYNQRPAMADGGADERYAEWDDASTIDAIVAALSLAGEVIRLEATPDFPAHLREASPDIVFNMAEGLVGANREGHVPAICEFLGIPYTGSDPTTLGLCLDKGRTKEILGVYGVPTPVFTVVRPGESTPVLPEPPAIVKPIAEGSGRGITQSSYCESPTAIVAAVERVLRVYEQPAIVEQWLPGREFTCAVVGNRPAMRVLPIVEIDFSVLPTGALPLYSFEAKWVWDTAETPLSVHRCPAPMPADLQRRVEGVALAACRALGVRDWGRVDVRCDAAGAPHVIEVNPIPGIIPGEASGSCYTASARAAGMSYDEMVLSVLRAAADRCGLTLKGR